MLGGYQWWHASRLSCARLNKPREFESERIARDRGVMLYLCNSPRPHLTYTQNVQTQPDDLIHAILPVLILP